MGFWIFVGLIVLVAGYAIRLYNRLVALRNASENAWSDVDVQLKRRWDLIPNLVETVKGYASHEQGTFSQVTELRTRAMGAETPGDKAAAEGQLTRALKSLFAVAEAYPDLKANQNFLSLQGDLNGIEEAIQNARRYYNAVVRDLNTTCETFPSNLVANQFGFSKKDYFELDDEEERTAPAVSF
ncbi:MAG: LemA family protein [Myxococcales bacterium]|nr:LemA family protein [Myxococcales bacterium]